MVNNKGSHNTFKCLMFDTLTRVYDAVKFYNSIKSTFFSRATTCTLLCVPFLHSHHSQFDWRRLLHNSFLLRTLLSRSQSEQNAFQLRFAALPNHNNFVLRCRPYVEHILICTGDLLQTCLFPRVSLNSNTLVY